MTSAATWVGGGASQELDMSGCYVGSFLCGAGSLTCFGHLKNLSHQSL